jgi:predicted transcriptional regulator
VKYRSRTEIISEILELVKGDGLSRTKIMYGAYLSFTQLKEYLNVLLYNGMLSYNKNTNKYRVTEKGLDFLKAHNDVSGLLSQFKSR